MKEKGGKKTYKLLPAPEAAKLVNDGGWEPVKGAKKDEAPAIKPVALSGDRIQDMQLNPVSGQYDIPVGVPYSRHAPKDEAGALSKRYESTEKDIRNAAMRLAAAATRVKYGSQSGLSFTSGPDGQNSITTSGGGSDEALTFYNKTFDAAFESGVKDAIKKSRLPKNYLPEPNHTGDAGGLPQTTETLDRLLPNTSEAPPAGTVLLESDARAKLQAGGYTAAEIEGFISMYKGRGVVK